MIRTGRATGQRADRRANRGCNRGSRLTWRSRIYSPVRLKTSDRRIPDAENGEKVVAIVVAHPRGHDDHGAKAGRVEVYVDAVDVGCFAAVVKLQQR